MYLENIKSPADVKKLSRAELPKLAEEIRSALTNRLSQHGGHVGPNYGFVEVTIALHYVFESPKDKLVFDVSHQTYAHKMLTGRAEAYLSAEHFDDISGYSEPEESAHDHFIIGHTSTSVSLASGLAKGRDAIGGEGNVVAVIGDGSLSGGEALEGLDFAGEMDTNFIIVVNDNQMSIAENHGGMYEASLRDLRESNGKSENNLFRAFGLDYIYVDKGNDIDELIDAFGKVKDTKKPVVVHINTLKGKGLPFAEKEKEKWHWNMPFDPQTGEPKFKWEGEDYGKITANYLLSAMKKDKAVVAVTAGTPAVFGFGPKKRAEAGRQFIDVGICEEHAAAMISGMAKAGAKPVWGVYSSFVQRAFDQIHQDICINKSPVTIIVFCGTLGGMNDVTHLGFFDISMLSNIPNLVYLAPATVEEYLAMLEWSINQTEYPCAIRVPERGIVHDADLKYHKTIADYGKVEKNEVTHEGRDVAIIGAGSFYADAEKIGELLAPHGINATLVNPRFVSNIDTETLEMISKNHRVVVTIEDGIKNGGYGEKVARYFAKDAKVKTLVYGAEKEYKDRYDIDAFYAELGMTPEQIANSILQTLNNND